MAYAVELRDLVEQPTAVVCGRLTEAELPAFLGGAFGEVIGVITQQGRIPAGPPFARYKPVDGGFEVEAGFPCSGPISPSGRVEPSTLPGGGAATTRHVGPYEAVGDAYAAVQQWIAEQGLRVAGAPWEQYLDGPEVPPEQTRTDVVFPCAKA